MYVAKRMHKVSKHLQQLYRTREQVSKNIEGADNGHLLIYIIIEGEKRKGYEHEKIDQNECCEQ